eukprot:m.755263 g.755263  ORF g.755263 m.755263 type:complete len:51 (+) comp59012_c1_seq1:92-244(+)
MLGPTVVENIFHMALHEMHEILDLDEVFLAVFSLFEFKELIVRFSAFMKN